MTALFVAVFNLSVTASVIAAVAFLVRRLLSKRMPRLMIYALWAFVLIRLIVPFSLPSRVSVFNAPIIPETVQTGGDWYTPTDTVREPQVIPPAMESVTPPLVAAPVTPVAATPAPKPTDIAAIVWVCGVGVMLLYIAVSYTIVARKLRTAAKTRENIYVSDNIESPIVFGLLRPRIYLPRGIESVCTAAEIAHIVAHERVHIRRLDHVVKLLSMLVLAVYWFNPVIWAAFIVSNRDRELACDERVMKLADGDIRAEYARSLVNIGLSIGKSRAFGALAFGESGIKQRIKSVVGFKKRKMWISVAAVVVLVAVGVACLTRAVPPKTSLGITDETEIRVLLVKFYLYPPQYDLDEEAMLEQERQSDVTALFDEETMREALSLIKLNRFVGNTGTPHTSSDVRWEIFAVADDRAVFATLGGWDWVNEVGINKGRSIKNPTEVMAFLEAAYVKALREQADTDTAPPVISAQPDIVPLTYDTSADATPRRLVELDASTVLRKIAELGDVDLGGGLRQVYYRSSEAELPDVEVFSYLEYGGKKYALGHIGYGTINDSLFRTDTPHRTMWGEFAGNGLPYFGLIKAYGANSVGIAYYEMLDDEIYAVFEIPMVGMYRDFDGDGADEIISTFNHSPNELWIYKYDRAGNLLLSTGLKECFAAFSVEYSPADGIFRTYFENPDNINDGDIPYLLDGASYRYDNATARFVMVDG
ncbi:MAG: M56 family metallopeptidase [Oscillospiraceae bacterium]|jgi:beta-lactamase regulating signal transducer with metallopeptidase domain|nr:M56 family metallopeptidase [Oscillospiraceae bacterium]